MSRDPQFSLSTRTPFHEETGEAVLRQVEADWHIARGTRMLPDRSAMAAQDLAGALTHSFTLERVTDTVARFRIAGQAIVSHLKMDPRGMPLSALFTPQSRTMLAPFIHDVCENPSIAEIPLIAQRRFAFGTLRARMLLLPLRGGTEQVDRIFGALVVDGKSTSRSLRFDIDPEGPMRIEHLSPVIRTIHEVIPQVAPDPVPVPPQKRETPAPRPVTQGLRLVVDNT